MRVNCARKKHYLALLQGTISRNSGFSGFHEETAKTTQ